ncbi:J domain-containing protein [Cylindrospermopsis raciborskii]|uniref:J domain-containing protein n=1 Tax=Cylindrospermopsis raciborskii TaxID=77022 RepID=UPI000778CE73|nr:J domain-containing protein [Cylindrospermopsis raciborskii]
MWQVIKDIIEKLQSWWGGLRDHIFGKEPDIIDDGGDGDGEESETGGSGEKIDKIIIEDFDYGPIIDRLPPKEIFPKEILFKNPSDKIDSLQKKVLEILFSRFNLSAKEGDNYVAYFPSRLLSYIKQKDAFFAFRQFLNDIGTTPDEVFKNREIANFVKEAILGLYEADVNCWDTPLSTEPLYQKLKQSINRHNLDDFIHLLNKLEKFAILAHQIERLIGKIPFHEFDQFSQEVKSQLKEWDTKWHTIPEKTVNQWKNSLNKYESQSTNYQNLCKQISQDFLRVESLSLTSEQAIVIEYLLKEVEELKEQLQVGLIETDEGLNQLEILADEIQGFVDEVSHRSRDAESSRTEDSSNKKLSLEEALMLLSLTLETLSLKSLKTSRNRYARIHHPDVGGDEKMMKKINQAYEILKEYLET